jgi:hypothetical protein
MGTPLTRDNTTQSIQHNRLTPTRRKAITRSRSRSRTSINWLSLRSPSSSRIRRSPNNCLGYPCGRLSVVKHRQLARQEGAFDAIAIKSSTDFDNMIFPMGSIFIFGSWVCEVDDEGNLQGCLVEALEAARDSLFRWSLSKISSKGLRCPNRLGPRQQLVSTWHPGRIPPRSPIHVLLKKSQALFQLDSRTRHQPFKTSIRTYFRFLPENWVTSQPDLTTWQGRIRLTPKYGRSSTEATSYQGTGRSCTNRNI